MPARYTTRLRRAVPAWFATAALAVCAEITLASTIVPMNTAGMADHAGQVIIGQVDAVRSYWLDNPRRIESEVTFEQVTYLKGRLPDSTAKFTLRVPGGTVGSARMAVCCSPDFAVGQKWVLFLLPTYKTHPVVGLYQGAFLVQPDADGVERIYSLRHGMLEPIAGMSADGFIQRGSGKPRTKDLTITDRLRAASRVRPRAVRTAEDGPAQAMRLTDFLDRIRPVVTASRSHHLTEPAGKPVGVRPIARPLVPAPATPSRPVDAPQPGPRPAATARPSTASDVARAREESP
jgi:hypothetical protein